MAMSTDFGMRSIVRMTSALVGRIAEARHRRGTARALEALPEDVLKDIGYGRDYLGT